MIATWLRSTHGDKVPCHHAVKIHVTETAELLSPAYTVDHVEEPVLRASWVTKYGMDAD